ncbi:diguanylate cyclase (GGDEF)-like protein [Nocardia kruczakiae]|uniref:Diguanylate cyclase (GGDEF)-like protein n=1 Tax=Nocardia kruczakiae TaxID=261477 RepID=A0ABU1XI79_9NOCA|nr:bifunctional diguanylate cyclase/phosphodiesterase [Nocardia kruczakiae]MDR7169692.1 diguanylate cyclase (GGDEF)-like protein [Nocardia kruczakiae]
MSRTTGAFFFVGGLLAAVVTALTGEGPGSRAVVFGAALVAVLTGILVYLVGERMPVRAHPILVSLGTVLITIAIHWLPGDTAAVTLSSIYVFVACDAAFFFSTYVTGLEIGFAVVCCMAVLGTREHLPWWTGVIAAGVTVMVGVVVTIVARRAAEADIDVLTGLLNRRGFDRLLNAEIAKAGRLGQRPALVLADLDQPTGDAVLQHVADTWSELLTPEQTLARLGGDLFAVLLPDTTERAAVGLTDHMRAATTTGCSAGVTSWQPREPASMLVSRADVGRYRAKQAGPNQTRLESGHRVALAEELRRAIAEDNNLEVRYQPIVSLPLGDKVVGVEALLRWSSATEPGLSTIEVIRAAEEYNLIADLDQAVLRRACVDAVTLRRTVADLDLTLNVNVSGLELADSDYGSRVRSTLRSTGWHAGQLVLEVTETQLEAESPNAIDNLSALRNAGVRIAIDDFGTGYSSLSRLAAIPADILKVDRSFVAAITADSPAPPLLGVIKALSTALDMEVIAEGVETAHQAAVLTDLGFSLVQGYHYSGPQTVQAILDELITKRGTAAHNEQ